MLPFLTPQMKTLNNLKTNGVQIDPNICICAMVLCGSCDLPTKASVLNFLSFNAFYGCSKCLQKGETAFTEKSGNVCCFPFQEENPYMDQLEPTIRTLKMQKRFSNQKRKESNKGVKALMLLPDYDIIRGTSIDYMHCALFGITKLFMSLWFDSSHKKQNFSLFTKLPNC